MHGKYPDPFIYLKCFKFIEIDLGYVAIGIQNMVQ